MLEAKWAEDKASGRGHRASCIIPLFTSVELERYEEKLWHFMTNGIGRTNHEIHEYGLECGFLPKHSNQLLKQWLCDGRLAIAALDGQVVRGTTTYISNRERTVRFTLV